MKERVIVSLVGLVISFAMLVAGAFLCYAKSDGWGWFVFIGLVLAMGFSNHYFESK